MSLFPLFSPKGWNEVAGGEGRFGRHPRESFRESHPEGVQVIAKRVTHAE